MKGATTHIREPLVSLTGVVLFPFGAIGAHHGRRWHLRLLAGYLVGLATLRSGLIAGDVLYVDTCHMYPLNVIEETMVNWFPPSPVTNGAQGVLRSMPQYPFDQVDKLTKGFPVLRWYLAWTGFVVLFLLFTARETWSLARLVERGPLGLGPCYGLGQWDQVLDKETLLRIKGKDIRSQFVEDCTMIDRAENWPRSEGPLDFSSLEEAPLAFSLGGGGGGASFVPSYGAAAQRQAFHPASANTSPLYLQPRAEDQEADHELDGLSILDDAEAEAAAAAAAAEEEERLGHRF